MNQTDSAENPLVRFQNVGMAFGPQPVLRDLSLEVPRGQTLVVIGESGCGKTVLLKLIIGLLTPSSGTATFDRKTLANLDDRELTRQRLRFGFLFQGAALFDSLTVFDNVAFGLRAKTNASNEQIALEVRQRLGEVGLPETVERKKPAELSGGMKKRVGLARALILQPEVMLYDEPTTGLDPIMSDVIAELIVQTRAKNPVTSVIVTHDMKLALKVADRVVMLSPLSRLIGQEGQILFDGLPEDLRRCEDRRVRQFVEGEAGDRLREMAG